MNNYTCTYTKCTYTQTTHTHRHKKTHTHCKIYILGLKQIPDYLDNYPQTEHPDVSLYSGTRLMFVHVQKPNT